MIAHASGLDQIGPLCATVEDAAIVLDAISFCDPQDSTSVRAPRKTCVEQLGKEISGIRFGVVEQYDRGTIQEVDQAMEEAAEILESLGAKRVNLKLPALQCALPVYYILSCAQAASNLGRYDGVRFGHRASHYDSIQNLIGRSRGKGLEKK